MPDNTYPRTVLTEDSDCKKCGKPFQCSKSPRCWCYEIDIASEKLEELQRDYDGCLCPDCLKEFE